MACGAAVFCLVYAWFSCLVVLCFVIVGDLLWLLRGLLACMIISWLGCFCCLLCLLFECYVGTGVF